MSARSPMNTSTGASGVAARIRATVASVLTALRATRPRCAPDAASWMAAASPMPLVAPVTIITGAAFTTNALARARSERKCGADNVTRDGNGKLRSHRAIVRATRALVRTHLRRAGMAAVGGAADRARQLGTRGHSGA